MQTYSVEDAELGDSVDALPASSDSVNAIADGDDVALSFMLQREALCSHRSSDH